MQFYLEDVSAKTIKLELPFPLADIPALPTRQKIHELENGLWVKEFSLMGLDDDEIGQLGGLVWYARGRSKPICIDQQQLTYTAGGWALGDAESDNPILSTICGSTHVKMSSCTSRFLIGLKCLLFGCSILRIVESHSQRPQKMLCGQCDGFKNTLGSKNSLLEEFLRKFLFHCLVFLANNLFSGGSLAAVVALEISSSGFPPIGLILVAPSLDNGPDCRSRWEVNAHASWLSRQKMAFYQDRYLPHARYRSLENWKASPVHAPPETLALARNFHTCIAAMGVDILLGEFLVFVERLRNQQCEVTLHEFTDYPHMVLAMQGVLGATLLIKLIDWLDTIWSRESIEEREEDVLEIRV